MSLTQINKAGLDEIALDHVFTIGASGSSAYTFQGEGLNGTVNNPTLYLTRGKTYRFENGSGGHPIRIQSTSGASGTAYNTGVTNNAGSGTVIVEVQHDAPDVLYYQCTSHAAMNGILYITGALADGGVTTAKIADDAVTDAKLANSINSAIAANTAKTTNATHTGDVTGATSLTIASSAVTTAKIADDAVTTAKIADGAITNAKIASGAIGTNKLASGAVGSGEIATGSIVNSNINNSAAISGSKLADSSVGSAKIADQAVTLDKLPHGTSSNDGKFLRANNGADPTFETITGTTINNNANNRVITGSDTANTLNGQSGFTVNTSNNVLSAGGGFGIQNVSGVISGSGGGQDYISIKDSGNTERVVVKTHGTNIGKVGIGMNNPDDTLDVNGTFHVSSNAYVSGTLYALGNDIRIGGTGTGNSLNDYEEGTFSPTIGGSSNNPTQSYANQTGYYTKIGDLCFVTVDLTFASSGISGGSGEANLESLPFTAKNAGNNYGVTGAVGYSPSWGSITPTTGYTNPNTNFIILMGGDKDTGTNFVQSSQVTNHTRLIAGFTYRTT